MGRIRRKKVRGLKRRIGNTAKRVSLGVFDDLLPFDRLRRSGKQ